MRYDYLAALGLILALFILWAILQPIYTVWRALLEGSAPTRAMHESAGIPLMVFGIPAAVCLFTYAVLSGSGLAIGGGALAALLSVIGFRLTKWGKNGHTTD